MFIVSFGQLDFEVVFQHVVRFQQFDRYTSLSNTKGVSTILKKWTVCQ
jgi:hypothetical protein